MAPALLTHRRSARKLTSVYHDNRREYVANLGLELYQSAGGAAGGGDDTGSEEESEEEDAFQPSPTPAQPGAVQAQQQQLALVPVPNQVAPPAPAARGERAPMAHLLSLVAPKRLRAGTLLPAPCNC